MTAWIWSIPRERYAALARAETFALKRTGRKALTRVQPGDRIFAYVSGTKALAGLFEAQGHAFQDTTSLVPGQHLPHRLRVRSILALPQENWLPFAAFADKLDVSREHGTLRTVLQQTLHPLPTVDAKVLEFLIRARQAVNLETMLALADAIRAEQSEDTLATEAVPEHAPPGQVAEPGAAYTSAPLQPFAWPEAMEALLHHITARGFVYEPWQVAAYVTALRTKPFVILAGITGTGKTKLPLLVADATGGATTLIPVRPDWTDSADVLGYVDLQGRFRPGSVLLAARAAGDHPARHHVAVLDEMNQARVEHYFAEVLSLIEQGTGRSGMAGGGDSIPLLAAGLGRVAGEPWASVALPANLALVGTVNMDESGHSFSRKVLDRAFTLELADVDLSARVVTSAISPATPWPLHAWQPGPMSEAARTQVNDALTQANHFLHRTGLHLAYRSRDEMARFVTHAAAYPDAFRTRAGRVVDPLDLVLTMKLLPRLLGSRARLRPVLLGLLGWALTGSPLADDRAARRYVEAWHGAEDPNAVPDARLPRTAARLCRMWDDLEQDGFTSFWGT